MKKTKEEVKEKKGSKAKNIVITILLVLYALTLVGFLVKIDVTKTVQFVNQEEREIIDTRIIPSERVECKLPKYDVLRDELVGLHGRKVTIQNNQDKAWLFTVSAKFTFTNRTTSSVPEQKVENIEESVTVLAHSTSDAVLLPSSNLTYYNNVYGQTTVTPNEEEDCKFIYGKEKNETSVRYDYVNRTYWVPYVEEKNLIGYLLRR